MTSFHVVDMPERLSIRTRVVGTGEQSSVAGHHVLCWLQHAWRVDENPALEVASRAATALGVPLVVYAEVGGDHGGHSNVRSTIFALEGLRDFAQQLEAKGQRLVVRFVMGADKRSPVFRLGYTSCLVVIDDLIQLELRRLHRFAPDPDLYGFDQSKESMPVWAVDCACVVPLGTLDARPERAFRFRQDTRDVRQRELAREWPLYELASPTNVQLLRSVELHDRLPWRIFGRGDWDSFVDVSAASDADLWRLVARSSVSFSPLPIGDTRGGSSAGYERWNAFKEGPIHRYHELRDDAAIGPNGEEGSGAAVSRMSAYLHYGMVSPFRLAREAEALRRGGSLGAEKYLDELLTWRELAHHWLHDGLYLHPESLPAWAKETLAKHSADKRDVIYPNHVLGNGETGVDLWDLAQRSLIRHGELHNNLRMTWGKAILGWTKSTSGAWSVLVGLNDGLALDGSDPSSYGGMLWCMGLFDRPFTPEEPVFGSVRTREVEFHAQRMDMDKYRRVVGRRQPGRPRTVAVIGAGMAGLAAARILADHGVTVTVFEKARGPGGRVSTRRTEFGHFDHGCSGYDLAITSVPEEILQKAKQLNRTEFLQASGSPRDGGASTAARYLAKRIECAMPSNDQEPSSVRYKTRVGRIDRSPDGWQLTDEEGNALGTFEGLIVTAPPAQTADLLDPVVPEAAARIRAIKSDPQWTTMVAFTEPTGVEDSRLELDGDEVLRLALRMPNYPGQTSERWVLHAQREWTLEHLEQTKDEAAAMMLASFRDLLAARGVQAREPALVVGHRWRYAFCESGDFPEPIAPGLAVAGDWAWRPDWPREHWDRREIPVQDACSSGARAAFLLCMPRDETPAHGS